MQTGGHQGLRFFKSLFNLSARHLEARATACPCQRPLKQLEAESESCLIGACSSSHGFFPSFSAPQKSQCFAFIEYSQAQLTKKGNTPSMSRCFLTWPQRTLYDICQVVCSAAYISIQQSVLGLWFYDVMWC